MTKSTGLRRIFRLSVMNGICAQIFGTLSGTGSAFLTRFAIMLKATPSQFAVLSAAGQVSQVFQPLGAVITGNRTRRKSVVLAFQAAGYAAALCFGVLPFVFSARIAVDALLLLFFLSVSLLSVAGNAWIGWISNMVPGGVRGRFFSVLSQYATITAIGAGLGFSLFIDRFGMPRARKNSFELALTFFRREDLRLGFAIVFLIAALAAFLGLLVLARLPEKEKKTGKESSMAMFFQPVRDKGFRRFLFYNCWWMLAVGIGAPFWQPFMFQRLHMSLFEVQAYNILNLATVVMVLRLWGRFIDVHGNKTAMHLIILLGGFDPMVWLFVTPYGYHILYLEAVTSGIMWAGAGLVATNFVLSIAPGERRQLYSGISGAISGLAMMLPMLLSGVFLPRHYFKIGWLHLAPEQVLFGLTGIARWSAQIPLAMVREPKSRPIGAMASSLVRALKPKAME